MRSERHMVAAHIWFLLVYIRTIHGTCLSALLLELQIFEVLYIDPWCRIVFIVLSVDTFFPLCLGDQCLGSIVDLKRY